MRSADTEVRRQCGAMCGAGLDLFRKFFYFNILTTYMADPLSANPPRLGGAKLTSKEIPSDNAFKASHLDMK